MGKSTYHRQQLIKDYSITKQLKENNVNHWANQRKLYEIFKKHVPTMEREYFASPLNVTDVFDQYCSRYENDKNFGSRGCVWKNQWDTDGVINPEFTDEQILEVINRMKNSKAKLILTIPTWDEKRNKKQMKFWHEANKQLKHIMDIPNYNYQPLDNTVLHKMNKIQANKVKWETSIFAINIELNIQQNIKQDVNKWRKTWNQGDKEYESEDMTESRKTCALCGQKGHKQTVTGMMWCDKWKTWTAHDKGIHKMMYTKAADKFTKIININKEENKEITRIYTDASRIIAGAVTWAVVDMDTKEMLGGKMETNNVTVGESRAIHEAIKWKNSTNKTTIEISSDSMTAISHIATTNTKWKNNENAWYIQQIKNEIHETQNNIIIQWVKAHTIDKEEAENDTNIEKQWNETNRELIHEKDTTIQMSTYENLTRIGNKIADTRAKQLNIANEATEATRRPMGILLKGTWHQANLNTTEQIENNNLYRANLDIEKAYDNVDHEILISRLEEEGMNPKDINIIKNIIRKSTNKNRYSIRTNGEHTNKKRNKTRVPNEPHTIQHIHK